MKKTPELYKNPNINPMNNNKAIYRIREEEQTNQEDIKKVLDNMFYRLGHSYQKKVQIITKDKQYETYIIARNKEAIFTVDNDKILIKDILKIKDCSLL